MKKIIAIMMGLFAFAALSVADEKKTETVDYEITMTGVTWGGCKKHVSSALSKLDGASGKSKDVKITSGSKSGTQKVAFTANKGFDKDALQKQIDSKRFIVTSVDKGGDDEEKDS